MADNMFMPSGSGGIVRYNEEYKSKFQISPQAIVVLIVLVVAVMAGIKLFF